MSRYCSRSRFPPRVDAVRLPPSLVSSLLYLPASSPSDEPSAAGAPAASAYLLSAGGDSTIQVFRLPEAELIKQFPISDLVMPYITVCAQRPIPIPAGRRKDKRGERKGKEPAAAPSEGEEDGAAAAAAATTATADTAVPSSGDGAAAAAAAAPGRRFSDLPKAMAVTKMLEIGTTRENGGVVVLVAGSTALLYIPFATLFGASSAPPPSLLPFSHPILDVVAAPVPSSAGSLCEVLVSFDMTRGPGSGSGAGADSAPLCRVSLRSADSALEALPTLTTDAVLFESACEATDPAGAPPAVTSLYPILSLLHHPGEVGDEADPDAQANDKRNRGKKRGWTTDPDALRSESGGVRPGKRAIGRAETLQRYEEAKRKLASGSEAATLTEGEKAAVEAIESEAQGEAQAAAAAVTEGAVVA